MPSRVNTVVLGHVKPSLVDIFAIEGRGTPRFTLRVGLSTQTPTPAQAETVLVPAVAPDMPLLDDDLRPVFAWLERIGRHPGLSYVDVSAVPTVLRILAECDLAGISAGRGCGLTVIVGRSPEDVDGDQHRAVQAHLAVLAAGGVDLVYIAPTPAARTIGRAVVVRRVLSPKVLTSLDAAGIDVFDAVFATSEQIAEATGQSHLDAIALQLATAEDAMTCRAAIWRGAGSALDVRLAAQAVALRRLASSGVGQRPPTAALEHADGTPSAPMAVLALASHSGPLELRQPRPGEAVAVVPTFDAATGTSGLVHMEPRLAKALLPASNKTSRPGLPALTPRRASRPPSLVGRLSAEIRSWAADRWGADRR